MKLDINGVLQLQKELKELEAKLELAKQEKGKAAENTWHDNFEYEQAVIKCTSLSREIATKREQLAKVELIKNHGQKDCIDIGDVVKVYDQTFDDEYKVLLTGSFTVDIESDDEIEVTSVNSPLGEAIYGKKKGDSVSYKVKENEHIVKIVDVCKTAEKGLDK